MTKLIDAMIIGVEKAGTTSLLRYLSEHEKINSHDAVEMPFFVDEQLFHSGWDLAYSRFFPADSDDKFLLAKSVGCIYWDYAPQRLYDHNPSMKVVAVLRNPLTRAYSAYRYAVQMGREDKPTFEEAIAAEPERLRNGKEFDIRFHAYLQRGRYIEQLRRVRDAFPEKQIKVIIFEEFNADPQAALDELFEFFGLPEARADIARRYNESTGVARNVPIWRRVGSPTMWRFVGGMVPDTAKKSAKHILQIFGSRKQSIEPMMAETVTSLEQYYAAEIAELEDMLERDLKLWATNNH